MISADVGGTGPQLLMMRPHDFPFVGIAMEPLRTAHLSFDTCVLSIVVHVLNFPVCPLTYLIGCYCDLSLVRTLKVERPTGIPMKGVGDIHLI